MRRVRRLRRLAYGTGGVGAEALPLDGPLQDSLNDRHQLPDGRIADARGLEVSAEPGDDLRRQVA